MKTVTVVFNECLHHVCLMYGLRQTFGKMPFLNRKVLETGGVIKTLKNAVAPPPMMRSPQRTSRVRKGRRVVEVSYWREKLSVEYREEVCVQEDIAAFVETLIRDYLSLRHPFMRIAVEGRKIVEPMSGHQIAEIL